MEILHLDTSLTLRSLKCNPIRGVDRSFFLQLLEDHPEHGPGQACNDAAPGGGFPLDWSERLALAPSMRSVYSAPRWYISDDPYPSKPLFILADQNAIHII